MNQSILRRLAALCVTLALILTMSACYQPPGATITPNDDSTTTTTADREPRPTVAQKDGQLTLSLLMGIMSADMKWSQLSTYTHTAVDASHANFTVADNYGKECVLSVAYDEATDTVSQAILSYGDVTADVLSDNTLVIRNIMVAMNQD